LRRLARATLEPPRDHLGNVCDGCGKPLVGRQRQWCSDRCRMFASRSGSQQSQP
jgi:hypothetical protein